VSAQTTQRTERISVVSGKRPALSIVIVIRYKCRIAPHSPVGAQLHPELTKGLLRPISATKPRVLCRFLDLRRSAARKRGVPVEAPSAQLRTS